MLCLTVLLCTLPVLLLCMIQCNEHCTTASQENNQFAFCDVPLHKIFFYTSKLRFHCSLCLAWLLRGPKYMFSWKYIWRTKEVARQLWTLWNWSWQGPEDHVDEIEKQDQQLSKRALARAKWASVGLSEKMSCCWNRWGVWCKASKNGTEPANASAMWIWKAAWCKACQTVWKLK